MSSLLPLNQKTSKDVIFVIISICGSTEGRKQHTNFILLAGTGVVA